MQYNYKQQVIAKELESILAIRTRVTTAYAEVSDGTDVHPVVTVGSTVAAAGGASIRVFNQRGNVDANWKALPGFGSVAQGAFTTGVAQILTESTGLATATPASAASGTFSLLNVAGGEVVTVGGITFTEGVDWLKGADDDAAATALAVAIAANPTLALIVGTNATASTNLGVTPSVVTITSLVASSIFNTIDISSANATIVASAATLLGGSTGSSSYLNPLNLMTIIAECASRGLKVELYAVTNGTAPTFGNFAGAVLQGAFDPLPYWPLSGRV